MTRVAAPGSSPKGRDPEASAFPAAATRRTQCSEEPCFRHPSAWWKRVSPLLVAVDDNAGAGANRDANHVPRGRGITFHESVLS